MGILDLIHTHTHAHLSVDMVFVKLFCFLILWISPYTPDHSNSLTTVLPVVKRAG